MTSKNSDNELITAAARLLGMKPAEVIRIADSPDGDLVQTKDGKWTLVKPDGSLVHDVAGPYRPSSAGDAQAEMLAGYHGAHDHGERDTELEQLRTENTDLRGELADVRAELEQLRGAAGSGSGDGGGESGDGEDTTAKARTSRGRGRA